MHLGKAGTCSQGCISGGTRVDCGAVPLEDCRLSTGLRLWKVGARPWGCASGFHFKSSPFLLFGCRNPFSSGKSYVQGCASGRLALVHAAAPLEDWCLPTGVHLGKADARHQGYISGRVALTCWAAPMESWRSPLELRLWFALQEQSLLAGLGAETLALQAQVMIFPSRHAAVWQFVEVREAARRERCLPTGFCLWKTGACPQGYTYWRLRLAMKAVPLEGWRLPAGLRPEGCVSKS